jgi:M-phase inducer tyrosine phosphatase
MEHSSPLAAMQPPSVLLGHCFRSDAPSSYHGFSPLPGLGGGGFNFKDLSMKRSQGDYFGTKSFRGSSPTASLAADLSQNFHIDQRFVLLPAIFAWHLPLFDSRYLGESTNKDSFSPQVATPRRSLFSACLFGNGNRHGKSSCLHYTKATRNLS